MHHLVKYLILNPDHSKSAFAIIFTSMDSGTDVVLWKHLTCRK